MTWATVSTIAAGVPVPERSSTRRISGARGIEGAGQLLGDHITPGVARLGVDDGNRDRRHTRRPIKPEPRLRVIFDVDVQQRMAVLHRAEGGSKRTRIQVVSKLSHGAEVHRALLLAPVIHPLESTKPTNPGDVHMPLVTVVTGHRLLPSRLRCS
jgi:hypothetical protein